MGPTERRQSDLVAKFGLRGSLFEQLIREPEGWADPDSLQDSPSLQRYAMDVRRALMLEGWEPPSPSGRVGRR